MTETVTREFAGIPVNGEFHMGRDTRIQLSLEDFLPKFNAVVQNTHVKRFGWKQYTPYFNDGDECVFGASSLWVETDQDDAEAAEEDENYYDHDEYFSLDYGNGVLSKHDWTGQNRVYLNTEPWVEYLRSIASDLASAVEGGYFDNVLLNNFGDHVEVTVYPGGMNSGEPRIELEWYEHD